MKKVLKDIAQNYKLIKPKWKFYAYVLFWMAFFNGLIYWVWSSPDHLMYQSYVFAFFSAILYNTAIIVYGIQLFAAKSMCNTNRSKKE